MIRFLSDGGRVIDSIFSQRELDNWIEVLESFNFKPTSPFIPPQWKKDVCIEINDDNYSIKGPKEEISWEVGKYYLTNTGQKLKLIAIWSEPDNIGRQMTFLWDMGEVMHSNKEGVFHGRFRIVSEYNKPIKREVEYFVIPQPDGTSRMFHDRASAEKELKKAPKGSKIKDIKLQWDGKEVDQSK